MIIVVEGPSAAGKTTWIRQYVVEAIIEEKEYPNAPARDADPEEVAAYWAKVSAERWTATLAAEKKDKLVVCDGDPFKLHYVWSLWRIGQADERQWHAQLNATRALFASHLLGLADLTLVRVPEHAILAEQAKNDASRERSNFLLHSQLAEPLREWYRAVEQLDPSRVRWDFPTEGIPELDGLGIRHDRSGTEIFDKLIDLLPIH